MKCKYCNAEIEQDAQFCTNCGKDLSKFKRCIKCGELLDRSDDFCPFCGTKQISDEQIQSIEVTEPLQHEEKKGSKKWIWFAMTLILLALIGNCGYWFYSQNSNQMIAAVDTDSIASVDSTMVETDIHSVDGIKARVNEIFTEGLEMSDSKVVDKFFSEDFRTLYKKVNETDKRIDSEMGFWTGGIWDGRQDNFPNAFEIVSLNTSSPQEAYIVVNLIHNSDEYHSENKVPISLVFENGNWFIDEISEMQYKESMQQYIKDNGSSENISLINKVFKGSGNGGGVSIDMTITFHEGGKCICVSDWYQAYSTPKSIKGTYEVKNDKVIVRCKDNDGTEYNFDFEIKSNGHNLEFNHSDPNEGGSMGNDFMSLEVQ
jgi:RNA polymerase subunit RPABC4/transcription elongation factor Spt4